MRLILVSFWLSVLLVALALGIVIGQPDAVDLFVVCLSQGVDLLFRKSGMSQTLDLGSNFSMNSRASHANEGPIRQVDALGKLGIAIGTLFVGGMLLGDFSELVGRTLHGLAAIAGIAGRACPTGT